MRAARFADRVDAGRALAARLAHLRGRGALVLGLPRGGVPVAAEVATALDARLDVLVVRKVGVPWQPELAMGAVGPGGVRVVNHDIVRRTGVPPDRLESAFLAAAEERAIREVALRGERPPPDVAGAEVIVVDDGLATGASARSALRALRELEPARLVLGVPVAPQGTLSALSADADEVVAVHCPADFRAVGATYVDFAATSDEEVVALLRQQP